jgi:hypothetical protein
VIHLFDLGDEIELLLDDAATPSDFNTPASIKAPDELGERLAEWGVTEEPAVLRRIGSAIELTGSAGASALELARILAAGYRLGAFDQPVFPFIRAQRGCA